MGSVCTLRQLVVMVMGIGIVPVVMKFFGSEATIALMACWSVVVSALIWVLYFFHLQHLTWDARGIRRITGRYIKDIFWGAFIVVVVACAAAFVVRFFAHVIFGREEGFIFLWKWSWVICFALWLLYDALLFMQAMYCSAKFARQYEASMDLVAQAFINYNLSSQKDPHFSKMTPDEFRLWISTRRATGMMADVLTKHIAPGFKK